MRADLREVRKALARVPQFQRGCFEALDSTSACFQLREVEAGETVISLGSPGDALFFILSGTFVAHLADDKLVTMEVGDFFGEIGLLLGAERTSSVESQSSGRLLVLPGEHLSRIIKVFPQLRREMEQKARTRAPELMTALEDVRKS